MTRQDLTERLLRLPCEIARADQAVASSQEAATRAEATFILGTGLDGAKNDTERRARIALFSAERELNLAMLKAERDCLRSEFSALRSVLRTMGDADE